MSTAIASDRAVFGAPELRRGVADAYHAAILPEHVGIALARDMLFTGRRLTAHEAERHGLVARVVAHEQLVSTTNGSSRGVLVTVVAPDPVVRGIMGRAGWRVLVVPVPGTTMSGHNR